MNKRALLILSVGIVFALILSNFALAANETESTDISTKAYNCLKSQIDDKGNLSFSEAVFSALAIGNYDNKIVGQIENYKNKEKSCWQSSGCKLKETALVALAYKRIGKDTSAIKDWILSKSATSSDLSWFLEIDITNNEKSGCKITGEGVSISFNVNEDMTISSSSFGTCSEKSGDGFMLKIKPACLNKELSISCDKDFVSSLLYQKSSGGVIFVLPDAHSGTEGGTTSEKINSLCFKTGASCDYEGTLWATLALQKLGFVDESAKFMPYLISLADDGTNAKYFPATFLYILAGGGEEQYNSIINLQKSGNKGSFWEISGSSGKYYDTSLAMMSLGGDSSDIEATKSYLANVQGKDGCWNNKNIKDTAFLLYGGWTKSVSSGELSEVPKCVSPLSCENPNECLSAELIIKSNYDCSDYGADKECCSKAIPEKTCDELGGEVCDEETEECASETKKSFDGKCCLDECLKSKEETCEEARGTCKGVCGSDEETGVGSCEVTDYACCVKSTSTGSSWIWIIILIVLIILVIIAIIFREKLKIAWFKFRHRSGNKPSGPSIPPGRQIIRQATAPFAQFAKPFVGSQMRARTPYKDKDMENTLKKLKDISKK